MRKKPNPPPPNGIKKPDPPPPPPKTGRTTDLFTASAERDARDARKVVKVIVTRKLERDKEGRPIVTKRRIYQLEIQIDRFCLVSAWMYDGGDDEQSKAAALELVEALSVCKRCPVLVEERDSDGPWITIQEK